MSGIETGSAIGNGYTLGEKMGQTSLGELYLGTNASGEAVRIEVLAGENADDPEKVQRLLHEIELIASMDHPNVTKATDAGQDGDVYFLVTVHEPGKTLDEFLKENGALGERQALEFTAGIASALDYAWTERKILHRDIKPSSIFITESGTAKLLGFGIAKSTDSPQSMGLTGAGFTIGTPEYMSPEQIRAETDVDFRADLYSLGCVAYEMTAGQLPFIDSAPILIMHKHMDEDPEPVTTHNSSISQTGSDLILQMLAKDKADRFATWSEFLDTVNRTIANAGNAPAAKEEAPAPAESAPEASSNTADAAPAEESAPAASASGGSPTGLIVGIVVVIIVIAAVVVMMR